jgi:multidrug efflux pump subunit AcrA (membrane-fusion protein)
LRFALLILASAGIFLSQRPLSAQTAPPTPEDLALEDPAVLRAKLNLDKMRVMVDSGTLPKVRLDKAEAELADALDEALITRALYGRDLTTEQAAAVVQASQRRVDRRRKAALDQQQLMAQGVISQSEMKSALDDLERVSKEHDWAVARERLVAEVANFAAAEMALMKQMEEGAPIGGGRIERFVGKGEFSPVDFSKVQTAFTRRFLKPLPISANGETAVHRSMGFDHRNRIDVAIYPDSVEGQWLRSYLTTNHLPYFAFRGAVAHQATGAHIHMGPPSTRYVQARTPSAVSRPGTFAGSGGN